MPEPAGSLLVSCERPEKCRTAAEPRSRRAALAARASPPRSGLQHHPLYGGGLSPPSPGKVLAQPGLWAESSPEGFDSDSRRPLLRAPASVPGISRNLPRHALVARRSLRLTFAKESAPS